MRAAEILTEGATPILYHYCSTGAALKIVSTGKFLLSISTGTKAEEKFMPPGYPYFLSLTRSKVGDYHRYTSTSACMFVLDGNWLASRYKVKPIDYWERMLGFSGSDRTRESEDRVFSRTPDIPIDGVLAIHVLLKKSDEHRSPEVRKLMLTSKLHGIPSYLYVDEKSWRLQDTRKAVSIAQAASYLKWTPPENYEPYRSGGPTRDLKTWRGYHEPGTPDSEVMKSMKQAAKNFSGKDYLIPWVELIQKNDEIELSPVAKKLLYQVKYSGQNDDLSLTNDLANARKPNSGREYETAAKIVDFMRRNRYTEPVALKNALKKRWEKIEDAQL